MSRALKITRGRATGNDFVMFSDPAGWIDLTDEEYASLVARNGGAGNWGVIRAVRSEHVPEGRALLETNPDAEWFLDHRNPDGSATALCGNALRVFVAYLMAEGLVELKHGDRIATATRFGVKDGQVGSNGVFRVDLDRWSLRDDPAHIKMALDSISIEPFEPLVDDGIGRLSLRMNDAATNECSSWATAAVAAALDARHRFGPGAPHNWRVDLPDGSLGVQMFPTEDGEHVSISGPAGITSSATVDV